MWTGGISWDCLTSFREIRTKPYQDAVISFPDSQSQVQRSQGQTQTIGRLGGRAMHLQGLWKWAITWGECIARYGKRAKQFDQSLASVQ
jgi:hypothetical protein